MEAALRLFADKGYTATSIEDILAAASTARGTFYLHFAGKSELISLIVDTYLGRLDAILQNLDISQDRPTDELMQLYRDGIRLFVSIPAVKPFVKVMLRDAMGTGSHERVQLFFERVVDLSARYITRAQERGRVAKGLDPVALSVCIVGSVKEVLLRWTASEDFELETAVNTAIEVYFRGMGVPGGR